MIKTLQNRAQLWLMRIAFVLVLLLSAAWMVAWDPRKGGFRGSYWWPTLVHNNELETWLYNGAQIIESILLVLFVALMAARILQATRPERRELVPVAIARRPGSAERGLGRPGTAAVRAWHRAEHRPGRCGAARKP